MHQNSISTNNYNKTTKTIALITIAFSLTACNYMAIRPQSKTTNKEPLKVAVPTHQLNPKSRPPAKMKNLNFTTPAKYQGKTVYQIKPRNQEKVIALTVDDGPWTKTTSAMLDIFKQNNVKVTFFWVGNAVQANPEIAKRVVAEGHAISNHTWHHWYRNMDTATAKSEIERTNDLIYKTTGVKTSFFRPPGGYLNNGLAAYAKNQQNSVVLWSVTSADTDPHAKPQAFVKNVLKGAKPGAIVLMHDGGGNRERTVKAIPEIISGLKQQGYRFVTVPELLEMQ
jgi:hypothetical protein